MCPSEPHTGEEAVTGQGLQLFSWASTCPDCFTLNTRGKEGTSVHQDYRKMFSLTVHLPFVGADSVIFTWSSRRCSIAKIAFNRTNTQDMTSADAVY